MVHAGDAWNRNRREGNVPIPIGGVVTLNVHHVDRAHPDAKRVPAVVVEVIAPIGENGCTFYRVASRKGVLKNTYMRAELIHEIMVPPSTYGLDEMLKGWRHYK